MRLSHSKLETLAKCPQLFYRRYILKEPQKLGAPLILGRAFHKALEENFKHKLAHKVDLSDTLAADAFRESFEEEAKKPTFIDLENLTEDQVDWEGEDPKDLREQGVAALLRYHRKHVPFLEPLASEEKIEMDLPGGHTLVGVLDLITTAGVVIDFKLVGGYPWPATKVEMAMQPTVYAALLDTPINFDFHFIVRKPSAVGISIRRTQRVSKDIDWLLNQHIPDAIKLIESEIWIRNPSPNCIYCEHRLTCGYRT